jgi:hypothetical protein
MKYLLIIPAFAFGVVIGGFVLGLGGIAVNGLLTGGGVFGPNQDIWIRTCSWLGGLVSAGACFGILRGE